MIVLTGGRRSGKTAAIIRWLLEDPQRRAVVVTDARMRDHILYRLQDTLPSYDWRHQVITANDYARYQRGGGHSPYTELAFDDLEKILEIMFGAHAEMATVNATWIPLGPIVHTVKAEVVDNDRDIRSTDERAPREQDAPRYLGS
jgi:hypothetical protein